MVAHTDTAEPTRRDFLYIATGAVAAVGVAGFAWPFVAQMNPDASVLALRASSAAGSARATARTTTPPGRIRKGPAPRNLDVPPYEF
jgi:ubiquinol-cytochrome c reductase iron-sulfur subunit